MWTNDLIQVAKTRNAELFAEEASKATEIYNAFLKIVLKSMDKELKTMCCRSEKSILRNRTYDGLSKLTWQEVIVEIEKNCPTTMRFLVTLVDGNYSENTEEKKVAPICLMYAIPMFLRAPELSRLQRLNTVLLTEGGASKMASSFPIVMQ